MSTLNLSQALQQLQARGLPRLEAQMLLLHLLGRPLHERAWLLSHGDQPLPPTLAARLQPLAERRLAGEPLAYLVGQKDFHGLTLQVDARVLDPRDDTETLVDWALALLPAASPKRARVLDLGTGSGAVALAVAHARPGAQVSAVDASADALAVAAANGQRLKLQVQWLQGHWFAPVAHQLFELVLSNPPYIAEGDAHLPALRHEPRMALVSGADGLDDIRHIVAHAPQHLAPGGWLLLEHGWDHAEAVRELLTRAGFAQVSSRRDLAGIERCSGGQWGTQDA